MQNSKDHKPKIPELKAREKGEEKTRPSRGFALPGAGFRNEMKMGIKWRFFWNDHRYSTFKKIIGGNYTQKYGSQRKS